MRAKRWFLLTLTALGALSALGLPATAQKAPAAGHGIDLSAMDPRVKPCDDFYQYANGHWLATAKIPADYPEWDAFGMLYERNLAILHTLANAAAADKKASPKSAEGEVGAVYRTFMDTKRIEAQGVKPLAPELGRIAAIEDVPGLLTELAHLHRIGVGAAFSVGVEQDPKASERQIAAVGQGGTSLPERGYYERTDADTQKIRDAFTAHVVKVFGLLGETPEQSAADAQTVLGLETKLAVASKYPVELRDPQANYHKMTLAQFETLTPGIDWQPYFDAVGLKNLGGFDVGQPAFFTALGGLLTSVPLNDWKTELRWQLIDSESGRLSSAFDQEHFHFYGTILRGTPQQPARWKRGVQSVDAAIGEALGQLYVAKTFPPAAKARALALVQNEKAILRDDLSTLSWMSPQTRKEALVKIDAMAIKIGYPDKWRDYSKLDLTSPDYVINRLRAEEFEFQRNLNKIGKPVDRGEWGMSPPTVNAYYNPAMNDINFPAGILQPPYFDPKADDAVNYGGIGMVIGHEMTHGFDDQGRQYDAHGNLKNWWTASDAKNFAARATGIVGQYSAYEPLPGAHINGSLTQGENIADIGGLKIAYLALEKSLAGKPRVKIQGFTPEQRFFIAFAQLWRGLQRPESEHLHLATDPHSPDKFRVLGPLADMPEFRKAFHCPPAPKASPTTIW